MNRGLFKGEFINELMFFGTVAQRDLKLVNNLEKVESELITFTSSFYGARMDFDQYASKKCYFIATYAQNIIKGKIDMKDIEQLCDEIEAEEKIREMKP